MTLLAPVVGPVVEAQLIFETPRIAKVPAPVGMAPPLGGVTVAVRVYEEPSATVVKFGETVMDGIPKLTKIVRVDAVAATAE